MAKLKNLFDYAPKELSQDGFLRWLFENYNCDDSQIKFTCNKLLSEFIGLGHPIEQIDYLVTYGQMWHIDILIDFVAEGKRYLVAIEDKVSSNEHNNQLQTYRKKLSNKDNLNCLLELENGHKEENHIQLPDKYEDVAFIYYKINKISYKNEFEKSCELKNVTASGWKKYEIGDIDELLTKNINIRAIKNEILSDYINHIHYIWELYHLSYHGSAIKDFKLLNKLSNKENSIFWEAFLNDFLNFKGDFPKSEWKECPIWSYRGIYTCMYLKKYLMDGYTLALMFKIRFPFTGFDKGNFKLRLEKQDKKQTTIEKKDVELDIKKHLENSIFKYSKNQRIVGTLREPINIETTEECKNAIVSIISEFNKIFTREQIAKWDSYSPKSK